MFSLIWVGSIIATIIFAEQKKLNVVVYLLLAIVMGPIALLIVLLSGDKSSNVQTSKSDFSIKDAKEQLTILKQNINYLKGKTDLLEEKLNKLSGEETKAVVENAEFVDIKEEVRENPQKAPAFEGFEQVFGKYWLNRIGVVLFVVGIGLFISYTFQYLNAFAKVAIGYAFSVAFFLWGNFLEKKEKYTKIAWGILGGAWGLLYLSTYAMHYIQATKILSNPTIEIILLAIVSIAAVYYNLKYKSWIVTAITFILAFITAGLGAMDYSSIVYYSLLTCSIAYLAYKMNWHTFLLFGIMGSYITHGCWVAPRLFLDSYYFTIMQNLSLYQFQIIFSILAITWAIYSLVFFMIKQNNYEDMIKQNNYEERRLIVSGELLNAGFFTFMGLYEIDRVLPSLSFAWDAKFWFLIVLAVIYFIFSYLFKIVKQPKMIVINTTIALTLATMAIFIRVPKLSIAYYLILEMVMLFVLGVYYKEKIYRMLAGIMSILVMLRLFLVDFSGNLTYTIAGLSIEHDILIFSLAALCFYMLSLLLCEDKYGKYLGRDEIDLYSWAFPIFGTLLLVLLFHEEIYSKWLSLSWTLLGAVVLGLGFLTKNRVFRLNALCVLSLACLRVVFVDMSGVNTIYKIVAFTVLGALLLGISMIYSKFKIKEK